MTNRIALVLGILIIIAIMADFVFLDWGALVFLGRKFISLSEWIAFWR